MVSPRLAKTAAEASLAPRRPRPPRPSGPSFDPKEPEADAKRGFEMEATLDATLRESRVTFGAEEKASAFGEYLKAIGLPAKQVLGDLGPAEVEDVISFFYAGMPDRFEDAHTEPRPAEHETTPLPEEHWCAASWEAEGLPHGLPHRAA